MGEARVALTLDGPVAHVALARPDARNALDGPTAHELRESVRAASAREDVRVIVLAGQGAVFCAGADIAWMKAAAHFSREESFADAGREIQLDPPDHYIANPRSTVVLLAHAPL